MVVRVAEQCVQAKVHRVVVASDSDQVVGAVRQFGFEAILTRSNHPSGTDRLAEAAQRLAIPDEDVVVNVQGDEPLIEASLIDALVTQLMAFPVASIATAAHRLPDMQSLNNPNIVKLVLNRDGEAMYFSRSPIPHDRDQRRAQFGEEPLRHVGIYAYRMPFLRCFPLLSSPAIEQLEALEQLRALWHGFRITVYQMREAGAPGVDTPEDLELVRALFRARSEN